MAKFSLFVRNLTMDAKLREALEKAVIVEKEGEPKQAAAPGQLRKMGQYYGLTYLRIVKVKNFSPGIFDYTQQDINSIRFTTFMLEDNKLLVRGSKGDVKEIAAYLEALALPLSETKDGAPDTSKLYQLNEPVIDLFKIISQFENDQKVENIRKIRMKKVEVKLGKIENCIINTGDANNTSDYGGVRKVLEEPENGVFGMEIFLKQPAKSSVYYDLDGQIRLTSKDPDADLESLTIEFAKAL